ncbi:lactococcin 972 family bacteriocin [Curtobacterium sp. RRHDQ10]|uniref:lactococcin 972 family bacteriocin n=1 Tax=Curtobacterium phyllosphaerae TaxID=3413379 RepID=UPI003BF2EF12
MKIRMIACSAAVVALGAALVVPVAAHAAPSATADESGAALVRVVDADEGFGVVEPSGISTRKDKDFVEFPEGGGTWYHGIKNGQVYSNFYHYTRKHGSSVINGEGWKKSSRLVDPRLTSNASISSTIAGNTAYYRFG